MLLMGVAMCWLSVDGTVRAAVLGFQEIHEKCIDLLKGGGGRPQLDWGGQPLSLVLSSQEDSGLSLTDTNNISLT